MMATDPTPDSKPPAAGTPSAMTPHAIGVALFAAFVVGGILAKVVPLWVVVLVGLVVGAAVFVLVDRYSRLPGAYYGPVAPDPGSCTAKFVGCTARATELFLLRPC
jgi:hypothetical protein